MECKKCACFPCVREECNLQCGRCEYGISLVEQISREMRKEREERNG